MAGQCLGDQYLIKVPGTAGWRNFSTIEDRRSCSQGGKVRQFGHPRSQELLTCPDPIR
jgi:hypothetical protein